MFLAALIRVAPDNELGRIERIISYVKHCVADSVLYAIWPILGTIDAVQLLSTIMLTKLILFLSRLPRVNNSTVFAHATTHLRIAV